MKKFLLILLFIIMTFFSVSAFAADPIPVESITLDQEEIIVFIGKTASIKATPLPKNASIKKLEWTSSDDNIATVNNGKIKAISSGTATITVSATDGSNKSASVKVTVGKAVNSLSVSKKNLTLPEGVSQALTVTIKPEDAMNKKIEWSSSNPKVAVVDENGTVTAIAKGSATITAATTDGTKKKINVPVKVEHYDLVFHDRSSQKVQYSYGTGTFNIKGSVKNGNVALSGVDGLVRASVIGGSIKKEADVTPVHPGPDTVTISVNRKKFVYTVFVCEDALTKANHANTSDLTNATPLEFSSITPTEAAELQMFDGTYELKALKSEDPSDSSNTLCFVLQSTTNFADFTSLTFYIKDLQGSNTHKVTFVDASGKSFSTWINQRSKHNEWIRVDAPMNTFAKKVDLENITEIRIGEWNAGTYIFESICLTNP